MIKISKNIFNIKKRLNDLNNLLSSKVCCFTGYRPQKCPWGFNEKDKRFLRVKEKTKQEIEKAISNGYDTFLCGMAIGFDMMCAEIVLELKKNDKNIRLIGALPCRNQDEKWNNEHKQRYKSIIKQLDCIRCIYDKYEDGCMKERNKFMINNSSLCIALFDGKPGGTKQTIDYAKSLNKEIIYINF